jgi:hypothetical protein
MKNTNELIKFAQQFEEEHTTKNKGFDERIWGNYNEDFSERIVRGLYGISGATQILKDMSRRLSGDALQVAQTKIEELNKLSTLLHQHKHDISNGIKPAVEGNAPEELVLNENEKFDILGKKYDS